MLNKKYLFVFAVIINVIIAVFLSVNVWADDAPAGDEQATMTNYLPDALIVLDLSGSMAFNPAGDGTYTYGSSTSCVADTVACSNPSDIYYVYSDDSTCTPDTVNCPGSNDTTHTYIYGHDATCTANATAGACIGTGSSTYIYAHDSSCTSSPTYCSGSGCSGGFCNGSSHSNCTTNCSNSSGKYGYCSGGFCGTSKTGCSYDCNCNDGMCHNSKTNCSNQCSVNKCNNGFCSDTAQGDCQTNCSRLAIAQRSLFSIFDDNNDNIINVDDATSLGIRFGFMRYKDTGQCQSGDDTAGDYTSGAIKLVDVISALGSNAQTSYQLIYCGDTTSCASTATSCGSGASECIVSEAACGGTPLASALKEAKTYLDAHKASDTYKACRQKFVILITDGADTFACSGSGGECQSKMYARRRESVAAAKQLADTGYKVFVVGFGSAMPAYMQNTLNWMAWYGGTDNPLLGNTGSKTAYNIRLGCNATPAVPTACCNLSTNASACFPSGITSCQTDSSTITNSDCGSSTTGFQATNNDPGYLSLAGYAFLAGDSDTLTAALKSAIDTIKDATYSFTQASVQASRTIYDNFLYEASFEPLNNDPFWIGHLKRYSICDSTRVGQDICTDSTKYGQVFAASDWDAGKVLKAVADNGVSSPRNIYTINSASSTLQPFTSTNPNNNSIFGTGITTDAQRIALVKFIRQGELDTKYQFYHWKLGDILHSSPISITSPNPNFYDVVDQNPTKAYKTFTDSHQRTSDSSNGKRLIIVGANDGQLHAFKTIDGSEIWSFIPPNLLPRLSSITHSSHPTVLTHTYFVDGPLSASDIWLPSGAATIQATSKSDSEWHTYLFMTEGRGGISSLWGHATKTTNCICNDPDCSNAFSPSYSATYNNYCGFYAFDVTDTLAQPTFKWKLGGTSGLSAANAAYLGQAWSKIFSGRVRKNNNEKWVGMIGGGYSGTICVGADSTCDKRGKGFYVVDFGTGVIGDTTGGTILWSFTHANNSSMVYNLVAGPIAADSDGDGFLDTAYIGDLGGNVWRFKFCLKSDGTTCGSNPSTDWKGSLLFSSPSNTYSIYTAASYTTDADQNLWVYFGTGDKTNPLATAVQDRVYAVKDSDRNLSTPPTYSISDLTNITSGTYDPTSSAHGWYIILQGVGEKMLAAPVAYDQKVYFTTYTPTTNPCDQNGYAKLYIVDYLTGAGQFANGARSESIGEGTPSGAVISIRPEGGYDVYVSTSAPILDDSSHSLKEADPSKTNFKTKNLIYWKDNRVK